MKTRNKIAFSFAVVTSVTLMLILATIYLLARHYTHREFFYRLRERTRIAAQFFFEEGELEQRIYEKIREEHLHTLTDEREYVLPLSGDSTGYAGGGPAFLPRELLIRISQSGYAEFRKGNTSGVGLRYVDQKGEFAVVVTAWDNYGEQKLLNLLRIMGGIWLGYLLVVFFLGRAYAVHLLSPVSRMVERVDEINTSNLHLRIEEPESHDDELARLARTFNNMLDRLETSIEAQGSFVANASHQLKNPLAAILAEVETTLRHRRSAEEYEHSLRIIREDAGRLEALILHLLRLAHTGGTEQENAFIPLRIDELLLDVKRELLAILPHGRMIVDYASFPEQAEALLVKTHQKLLKIALFNLLENAFKFSGYQDVFLSLETNGGAIRIYIRDQGVGIPDDALPLVFDPFFRAENVQHLPGFGIGLPMVRKIMHLHNGQIDIRSREGEGTTFILTLPRCDDALTTF